MWNPDVYQQTLRHAAEIHSGQKIPGTELPYLLHVTWVASEVQNAIVMSRHSFLAPTRALQIALLHDSIEDTDVTWDGLVLRCGTYVANAVQALSKDPNVEKKMRMADCIERIHNLKNRESEAAAIVKLADRITNLQKPPPFWKAPKITAYHQEALMIQEELGSYCPYLGERLGAAAKSYQQYCR